MNGPTASDDLIPRRVSRVIVLGPRDEILLFWANVGRSVEAERRPDDTGFWALPGGGVEPGEDHHQGAVRELHEETGIVVTSVLPLIAKREAIYGWRGKRFLSIEQYFLARVDNATVDTSGWTEADQRWMGELRWWSHADLSATEFIIRPPNLVPLIGRIITGDVPTDPVILPERPHYRVKARAGGAGHS